MVNTSEPTDLKQPAAVAAEAKEPGAFRVLARFTAPLPRRSRRLADKLLVAFHQACDQGDLEIAWRLLVVVEMAHDKAVGPDLEERRQSVGPLVAAHERLWELRHPHGGEDSIMPEELES